MVKTVIIIIVLAFAALVIAHPGRTDRYGGHYNRKTGEYHYHNSGYAPQTPTTRQTLQESSRSGVYVGSSQSNKYHYPSCEWARQINHYNRVTFASVDEARRKGYVACSVCNPPRGNASNVANSRAQPNTKAVTSTKTHVKQPRIETKQATNDDPVDRFFSNRDVPQPNRPSENALSRETETSPTNQNTKSGFSWTWLFVGLLLGCAGWEWRWQRKLDKILDEHDDKLSELNADHNKELSAQKEKYECRLSDVKDYCREQLKKQKERQQTRCHMDELEIIDPNDEMWTPPDDYENLLWLKQYDK